MTITILFKSGKEVSVKCDSVDIERDRMTGRITNLHFKGIKENKIMDLDFEEIAAIYRKVSDEVTE
jgi:hypothetical protein